MICFENNQLIGPAFSPGHDRSTLIFLMSGWINQSSQLGMQNCSFSGRVNYIICANRHRKAESNCPKSGMSDSDRSEERGQDRFWPFAGGHHVFVLDQQIYRYDLVSGLSDDYLWILGRRVRLAYRNQKQSGRKGA
jgi:hypothetical protein